MIAEASLHHEVSSFSMSEKYELGWSWWSIACVVLGACSYALVVTPIEQSLTLPCHILYTTFHITVSMRSLTLLAMVPRFWMGESKPANYTCPSSSSIYRKTGWCLMMLTFSVWFRVKYFPIHTPGVSAVCARSWRCLCPLKQSHTES